MALGTREANAHPRDSVFCGSIARMSCQHIEVTQKLPGECEPKETLNLKVSFGRLQGSQGARIYQYSRCFSTSNTLICSPPPEQKGTANQFIIAHGNYLPSTNTILLTHKTQSEPQPPFHKLQFLHFIIPFFFLIYCKYTWCGHSAELVRRSETACRSWFSSFTWVWSPGLVASFFTIRTISPAL